ncbi:MAG TPA: hypothetical protein VNV85_08490 [Puia sp.]|nr:hypothetical protein [Puia sp.]
MRYTSAYYLILLYCLGMFNQWVPVAKDALSHIFSEAIHLATVHAKYGNHHLQKELETTTRENSKNHNAIPTEPNFSVHVCTNGCTYDFYAAVQYKAYPFLVIPDTADIIVCTQSPPPKFS